MERKPQQTNPQTPDLGSLAPRGGGGGGSDQTGKSPGFDQAGDGKPRPEGVDSGGNGQSTDG